jgi:hypothetical protein
VPDVAKFGFHSDDQIQSAVLFLRRDSHKGQVGP